MKGLTKFWRKNWKSLVFVLLFLVTIFSRFYKLPDKMLWWDADVSDDMTVAYHIAHFGEKVWVGKGSLGGGTFLTNSYLYYYFLAGISEIDSLPFGTGVVMAMMSVLTVVLVYLIGKRLTDKKWALILMAMMVFNWYLDGISFWYIAFVCQSLMVVLMFWLFLKSWEERSEKILAVYVLVLMATLHFDYSILTIFPILALWGVADYFRVVKNKCKMVKFLLVIWPLVLFDIWLITSGNSGYLSWSKIVNFTSGGGLVGPGELIKNAVTILLVSAKYFLRIENFYLVGVLFLFIYGALGYISFRDYREKNLNWWKSFFIFSLILGVFGASIMGGEKSVNRYYVLYYYPLWLIALVYVGWRFLELKQKVMSCLFGGLLIVCFIFETNIFDKNRNDGVILSGINGGWKQSEMVAEKILADSKLNLIDNFNIVFYNKDTQLDNFGGTIFWYPLEKILGTKILKIVQYQPNIIFLQKSGSIASVNYLICYNFKYSNWPGYPKCETIFLEKHPNRKYKSVEINEGTEEDWSYKIFRIKEI